MLFITLIDYTSGPFLEFALFYDDMATVANIRQELEHMGKIPENKNDVTGTVTSLCTANHIFFFQIHLSFGMTH